MFYELIDQIRAGVQADRAQFFSDFSMPFYGLNRPGAKVSQGLRDTFLLQVMLAGFPAAYDCIKAFAQTDFTEDLKKFDVPTLIMHGDDDQIVPIAITALVSSKIVKGAALKVYPGLPHGMCSTHKDLIFLIRFSDQAEIVQDFTDDRRRILRAVEDLKPEGKTALYDAIVFGLQRVAQGKHQKRALLLVTDGRILPAMCDLRWCAILPVGPKSLFMLWASATASEVRSATSKPATRSI